MALKSDTSSSPNNILVDGVTLPVAADAQAVELITTAAGVATVVGAANPLPVAQTGALPAGGNKVGQVDIATMPASGYGTDTLVAYKDPRYVVINSALVAIQNTIIDLQNAAVGDNTIITAQGAGVSIRVLSWYLIVGGATNVQWTSGTGTTTKLSGLLTMAGAGYGITRETSAIKAAANTLLNLRSSAAVVIGGGVTWVADPT